MAGFGHYSQRVGVWFWPDLDGFVKGKLIQFESKVRRATLGGSKEAPEFPAIFFYRLSKPRQPPFGRVCEGQINSVWIQSDALLLGHPVRIHFKSPIFWFLKKKWMYRICRRLPN